MLYSAVTPEKAQQILDDSLQDGSVPQSALKAVAVGAARSGKTLSKKHIFGIEIDCDFSASTGVCEAPVHSIRSFYCQMFDASLPVWVPLTQESLIGMLGRKLQQGYIHGRVAEAATRILEESHRVDSSSAGEAASSGKPDLQRDVSSQTSSRGKPNLPRDVSSKSNSQELMVKEACKDYEEKMEMKGRYERFPKADELFKLQVILFLDSGGQPQFHELAPALTHNVSLTILYLKLNERLDAACCTAFTNKEGKWFQEQGPSLCTNEQMLVQFVHTMMSKPLAHCKGKRSRLMVIGTFRDLLHECDESLAKKNKRLRSLFLPALEEELIMNGDDVIFAVNALNPDTFDESVFSLIREKIADLGFALELDTPLGWFMFMNDLIKYAAERKTRVVSMEECWAIAGKLKMDRHGLEAALIHFNRLSMFLYMPTVLPDRVFVDPQKPLDIINEIVAYSYEVGLGKVSGLTAEYASFWKEGTITSEMLEEDRFSSCFVPGVFEAKDALALFKSLYIAAPLSESEFMMPAMLPAVAEPRIKELLPPPNEYVAPLLLHFHKCRIQNGSFCATHTCMRSKYGWTIYRTEEGTAECLFRNMVKLQHPNKCIQLTFVHAQKHFEVHVSGKEAELLKILHVIRDAIIDSVDSAARAFCYTKSRATVAFQCPCSLKIRHTALPTDDLTYLKCSHRKIVSDDPISEKQRVWLSTKPLTGIHDV